MSGKDNKNTDIHETAMSVDRRSFLGLTAIGSAMPFAGYTANEENEGNLLVGGTVSAQPGDKIEVPFEITNVTDQTLSSAEITVNLAYVRDLQISEREEWEVMEVLTRWRSSSPLSPDESITALLPVSISENAHGAYAIQAQTKNMDLEDSTVGKVHVPPLPSGPSLHLTAIGGYTNPRMSVSAELPFTKISDQPVCPEGTAAIEFYLRNTGTGVSSTPRLRPTIPDKWTISSTSGDHWNDSEQQWQLSDLHSGRFAWERIELSPDPDITDQSVYELEQTASSDSDSDTEDATIEIDPSACDDSQIDAEIISFNTDVEFVKPGNAVESTVIVENTGDIEHTFFVGYSMFSEGGQEFHNDGGTGTTVTLEPGEQETVTVTWIVPEDAPTTTYDAVTVVWEESDRSALETDLDTSRNEQAVTLLQDDIQAEILRFETDTGTVEPEDEVTSTVTVENTGAVDHTFFIGYSVISPEGREFHNDGETGTPVTVAAGEEIEIDLTWYVTHPTPPGTYNAITAVWLESDRSNLETQLAADENPEAFTVENPGFVPTVHGFGFPNWTGKSGCVIPKVRPSKCSNQYTFTYAEYDGISYERAEAGIEQWRETPEEQTKNFLVRTIPSLVNSSVATNGHCYGMIYSATEYFEDPTELPPDIETASEIPWPAEQYEAVGDRIRGNQKGQLLDGGAIWYSKFGFWAGNVDLELSLETIKNALDNEETVAIGLGKSGTIGGHVVLAYDYTETNGQLKIFLYDPNYPAEDHHENPTKYQSNETPLRLVTDADTGQLIKNYDGHDLYSPIDNRVSHRVMTEIVGSLESNIQGLIEDTADEVASWMVFELNSPASLEIDVPDAATVAQPEADFDFSGLLSDFAYIVGIPTSDFTISVQGHGDGEYTLDAFGMRNGNIIIDETISGTTATDEEDQFTVTVGETSANTTIEPVGQTESEMPGFGILSALAGAGGAAYLLKHSRSTDKSDK